MQASGSNKYERIPMPETLPFAKRATNKMIAANASDSRRDSIKPVSLLDDLNDAAIAFANPSDLCGPFLNWAICSS